MTVPAFGLGTFRLKGQVVIDSVTNAIELGYRAIDTAQIYENEADVGQAIASSGVARDELYISDEVFFTGTAAEVTPIREIDRLQIGEGRRGPLTAKIQAAFFDIVNGRNPQYAHWLTLV